jgi:hypothetical protein
MPNLPENVAVIKLVYFTVQGFVIREYSVCAVRKRTWASSHE